MTPSQMPTGKHSVLPDVWGRILWREGMAFALTVLALLWAMPAPVWAQSNSPEAVEAARKYRAEQAAEGRSSASSRRTRVVASENSLQPGQKPFSSGANPRANPNASLKSCLNHVGINPVARDRCMRRHCEGRWGQGDCPAGGDLLSREGSHRNTPLGRCLRDAGANPFKRDACGWKHCSRNKWSTAECAAIKPNSTPRAN